MTGQEQEGRAARRRALETARRSRAAILELAVRAEYLLGEALGHDLAIDRVAAAVLQEHMMWRVPIEVKLRLLSETMESWGISDTVPFVVPVLTRLFQVRNILAHFLEQGRPEHLHEIGFLSVHRGRVTQHSMRIDALDWLWTQGNQVAGELWVISAALSDLHAGALRDFYREVEDSQAEDGQTEVEDHPDEDDQSLSAFIPAFNLTGTG